MLPLLLALMATATEPEVTPPPICETGIVVERVSAADVDRARLVPVDTRGVRRTAVIVLSDDEASLQQAPSKQRIAAR